MHAPHAEEAAMRTLSPVITLALGVLALLQNGCGGQVVGRAASGPGAAPAGASCAGDPDRPQSTVCTPGSAPGSAMTPRGPFAGGGNTGSGSVPGGPPGTAGGTLPGACGSDRFKPQQGQPPNLMLVLDNTCSMGCHLIDGRSKWDALSGAIAKLVAQDQRIRFGLMTTGMSAPTNFPLNPIIPACSPSCPPAALQVAPALGTGAAIRQRLSGMTGGNFGGPSTCLSSVRDAAPMLNDPTQPNYVVLATDAFPPAHCEGGLNFLATLQEGVDAVAGLARSGVKTFVLGFDGGALASRSWKLNDLARAGMTARGGLGDQYYAATTSTSLEEALTNISTIVTCNHKLTARVGAPERMQVAFDGMQLPADMQNGWTYDGDGPAVVFHGAACDRFRSGGVSDVIVDFGQPCPGR
jgi:hypothetical protein